MISAATADLVDRALAEDIGAGDLTAESVVPADARARARIVQKAPGVLAVLTGVSLLYVVRGVTAEAAEESYKARVPVFAEDLSFYVTPGNKGESVGRECDDDGQADHDEQEPDHQRGDVPAHDVGSDTQLL